jgi:hypothetical protein
MQAYMSGFEGVGLQEAVSDTRGDDAYRNDGAAATDFYDGGGEVGRNEAASGEYGTVAETLPPPGAVLAERAVSVEPGFLDAADAEGPEAAAPAQDTGAGQESTDDPVGLFDRVSSEFPQGEADDTSAADTAGDVQAITDQRATPGGQDPTEETGAYWTRSDGGEVRIPSTAAGDGSDDGRPPGGWREASDDGGADRVLEKAARSTAGTVIVQTSLPGDTVVQYKDGDSRVAFAGFSDFGDGQSRHGYLTAPKP